MVMVRAVTQIKAGSHVCQQVRESSQLKSPDVTGESEKELLRLREEQSRLQEQLEVCCVVGIMVIVITYSWFKDCPCLETVVAGKK